MKKLFLILFVLLLSLVSRASTQGFDFAGWSGHAVRGDLGLVMNFSSWSNSSGANAHIEPLFEYGYEYMHEFENHFLLSAGLSWTISYPRNFLTPKGFFEPPTALWYTPMTYLQAGYVFNGNILLTGGLVYFWGLLTTLRMPLSSHLFFEVKSILWLDRIFDTRGFFGRGFDNFSSTIGIGYRF